MKQQGCTRIYSGVEWLGLSGGYHDGRGGRGELAWTSFGVGRKI